mgnify:CR=1 FL=1
MVGLAVMAFGCDQTVKIGDVDGGGSPDGGDGGTAHNPMTPYEQYCSRYAEAAFGREARCGEATSAWAAFSAQELTLMCSRAAKGSTNQLNVPALEACIAAYQNASCERTQPFAECEAAVVVQGSLPQDSPCTSDTECEPSLYCDMPMTCPGRCAPRIGIGQPVTATQRCVAEAAPYNGVCQLRVPMGMSCAPTGGSSERRACQAPYRCLATELCGIETSPGLNAPCDPAGTACGLGLQCVANTCVPKVALDGACDATRRCQSGLDCSAGRCVARTLVSIGGACDATHVCGSGTAFCNKPAGSTAGTCAPLRDVGDTCTFSGGECRFGLSCSATEQAPGVCSLPGQLGDACSLTRACELRLYCTATVSGQQGVCAERRGRGETCTDYSQCWGLCENGTCGAPLYCFD